MAKLTEEQKKWFYREFEDFNFRGYDLWMEVSVDKDIAQWQYSEMEYLVPGTPEWEKEKPHLVIQINEIYGPSGFELKGEAADNHYTEEELEMLRQLVDQHLADEAADWAERQADR